MTARAVKLTAAERGAADAIGALVATVPGLVGIEVHTGALDRLDGGTMRTATGEVTICVTGRKLARRWRTWRIPTARRRPTAAQREALDAVLAQLEDLEHEDRAAVLLAALAAVGHAPVVGSSP